MNTGGDRIRATLCGAMGKGAFLLAALAALALAACEKEAPKPVKPAAVTLTPTDIESLPGWKTDTMAAALPAWRRSCGKMAERPPEAPIGPGGIAGTAGAWQPLCRLVAALPDGDDAALRNFLAANFVAYRVSDGPLDEARDGKGATGIFTGYYEPELHGARTRGGPYQTPLYRLPPDHVVANLGRFDPSLAGKSVVGRVVDGQLVPYYARGDIEGGALADAGNELMWVDDRLDVFILHIQGSGVIVLPDGSRQRVGYAGNNGHKYASVGRWLIDHGELKPNEASWQGIRRWMKAHPDRVEALLAVNPRYIFFREIDADGPIGAAGVALTPERSLAVDLKYMPLDVPLWLDAESPDRDKPRLQRLMIAQDTGSAIRGVVRGDFFWGAGDKAAARAGRMKSQGGYWLLLPKSLVKTG